MAPSERVQSNTTSRTRRSRGRRRNRTVPTLIQRPLHQQDKCINPEERKRLVENQARNQTGYIYHRWCAIVTDRRPDGIKELARTYTSPELAKHDALCWLINRQNWAGASTEDYWTDITYEEEHERCCYYCTDDPLYEELGKSYYVWTTEERIY